MPTIVVAMLGVIWALICWVETRSMQVEEYGVNVGVVERYYDREMRLMEASDRVGSYGQWAIGGGSPEERLKSHRETIQKLYLYDLGESGTDLLDLIALELDGTEPTNPDYEDLEYRNEVRTWLLDGYGNAWDYELFIAITGDEAVESFHTRQNDSLARRAILTVALSDSLILIGMACIVLVWRSKSQDSIAPSRFTGKWPIRVILGTYFAIELLHYPWDFVIGIIYGIATFIIPENGAYLFYDAAWRIFPAFCLVILLIGKPNHAWRIFKLSSPTNWRLLLSITGATLLVNLLMNLFVPMGDTDPTDFFYIANPTALDVAAIFLSGVILAPVIEEIVFRGFLFQGLRKKMGNLLAGAISTLMFAVVHFQYDIWGMISVAIMGAGAAYLTLRTGSIKSAIMYHALINLLVYVSIYFVYQSPL